VGWVYVRDVGEHVGEEVTLKGWLYNKRSKGKLHFLLIRDGSGIIQAVVSKNDVPEESFAAADALTQESSVIVDGVVRADPRSPGGYELSVTAVHPVQIAVDYPISPKEHGVDFLMSHRHLWLRSSRQHAILRVRAEIIRAIRAYLDADGFIQIDTPLLTPAACEGTTNLFETTYFDEEEKAYLSQSGQLYAEAAAMAFGKVYNLNPAFRAERSKTRRHLIEFWMVEPEMAYFGHEDNMRVQENLVSAVVQSVLKNCAAELKLLERDTTKLEKIVPPFPRITYDEALRILKDHGEDLPWGEDFGGGHETILAGEFDRPVFVEKFPSSVKPFYMEPDPDRPEVALCDDLLAPEGYGEIIGGSQRIHDPELLEKRFAEHNLPRDTYEWYLDLRRYGSVPHSGFGMGIELTVAWVCGLEHVRETIPFPRLLYRMYP
jgi:asparaginyl-tRNA synthetase